MARHGSREADERTALSDRIAAYEDHHPLIPRGGPLAILRRLMETPRLSQRNQPDIGAHSVVSAMLLGQRSINARMAVALSKRFHLSVDAFLVNS